MSELKAKMKTWKKYYQLDRDLTILWPNNRPINSFVNNFINKDKKGLQKYLQNGTSIRY